MIKISNREWKITNIICFILMTITFLSVPIIFFIYEQWIVASILLVVMLIISFSYAFALTWPETITMNEEKIIVYRWGKKINEISWQNVKEIYRKTITINARYKFNCYYYFSDGQDTLLKDENGNEHFIVFKCPRKKEYLFSRFTLLPVQEIEVED